MIASQIGQSPATSGNRLKSLNIKAEVSNVLAKKHKPEMFLVKYKISSKNKKP